MQRIVLLTILTIAAPSLAMGQAAGNQVKSSSGAAAGTIAIIYYWKAKAGKLKEYDRYIREVAQPIDAEAQRNGAFISVTTYISQKDDAAWTHMRIFVLKDRAQLEKLSQALEAASARLEPDESKRKAGQAYGATLRDKVAEEVVEILR